MAPNPLVSTNLLSFLRFGALGAGLFVGFATDRKLAYEHKKHEEQKAHHDKLMNAANEEWTKYLGKELGISFNPDDKDFDLEKVINFTNEAGH